MGFDIVIGFDWAFPGDSYLPDRIREFVNWFEMGEGDGQVRFAARHDGHPFVPLDKHTTQSAFHKELDTLYMRKEGTIGAPMYWRDPNPSQTSYKHDQAKSLNEIVTTGFMGKKRTAKRVQKVAVLFVNSVSTAFKYEAAGKSALDNDVIPFVVMEDQWLVHQKKFTEEEYFKLGRDLAGGEEARKLFAYGAAEHNMKHVLKDLRSKICELKIAVQQRLKSLNLVCLDEECNGKSPMCEKLNKPKERKR
ncbi:hypothetical protein L596_022653 [Steinernema carpocapsae]|uniref:Uncharacterized protein n=1 Tax=Steinernema carpocapsae TaxID=34508 RepID=A0A4U5MMC1_STECR|nr:hypothetical protein L596_022653 [Steinernema carpocapsae]